jgi:allantoin racemase
MKLLYLLPGNVEIGLGFKEMERRQGILQKYASEGTTIDIDYVPTGPASIESEYEELVASVGSIQSIIEAEKNGYDGVIVGCFGDPGLEGAREMVKIPVIGPGAASMALASLLGNHYSIITVMDSLIAPLEHLALKNGFDRKLASIRSTNVSVLDVNKNPSLAKTRAFEEAKGARDEDRADVIVLGCMSLAFSESNYEMSESLGIPVINPVTASLKVLESIVAMQLSHSKKAFPIPPKYA